MRPVLLACQRFAGRLLRLLLLVGTVVALAEASRRYPHAWDLTANNRHSLSPESATFLRTLTGPVTVTAYLKKGSALRGVAREFVALYQEVKPDIALHLIDPATLPPALRRNAEVEDGTVAIQYRERHVQIHQFVERDFTNALAALARTSQSVVAFVGGHGERSPTRPGNHDLSRFVADLTGRGMRAVEVSLPEVQLLPKEIALLVLAGPEVPLLPGEVEAIRGFVAAGGNLLWSLEPGAGEGVGAGLEPLAADLGLARLPGVLVDPSGARMSVSDPTFCLVEPKQYRDHPALGGFRQITLWPHAAALQVRQRPGEQATPLVESGAASWVMGGTLGSAPTGGAMTFDEKRDLRGPHPLAYAIVRKPGPGEQRIVLLGGGGLLANQYLDNGANADLGVRLAEWLTKNEVTIPIATRPPPDRVLSLDQGQANVLAGTLIVGLPLPSLGIAAFLWWRRRRR